MEPGRGNVQVSVERLEYDASSAAEVEILWRYAGRGVEIEAGDWSRTGTAGEGFSAKVRSLERSGAILRRSTLSALALDGGEAEILLWDLDRGASLLARPRRREDRVELDLLPRFVRADGRVATLEQARTRVQARPGVPLLIGGLDSASDSLAGSLFSRSTREGTRRILLVLTVRTGP